MEGLVKEALSGRGLRRRRREEETIARETVGSEDTGRLETVLTTPGPASYCIDPFPLVLQETPGVSLPGETLRGEFLSLKRPSVTPGTGSFPETRQKGLWWSFGGTFLSDWKDQKDRGIRESV